MTVTLPAPAVAALSSPLVATAHYLVRVMWSMLKHGTSWEENPARAS